MPFPSAMPTPALLFSFLLVLPPAMKTSSKTLNILLPLFLLLAGGGTGAQGAPAAGAAAFQKSLGVGEEEKLRARLAQVNADIATRGITTLSGTTQKLLTGYSYGEFYDWDLYFENLYLSCYGVSDYCFSNFQAFLDRQQPDGFVSRSIRGNGSPDRNTQMFKPFLAQIAVLGSEQHGSYEWLRGNDYGRLKKYLDRWFGYDGDHNGLPVWDSSDASGMDNQTSRAGNLGAYTTEGVDLACELVREEQAMTVIADHLGQKDDAKAFRAHTQSLAKQINAVFWDDKEGFYYDRNEKTGRRIRVKSVAGFFPLWAGVAPKDRARRLIREHLLNPKEFWLLYPVAGYAKTEPDYYQGSRGGECNWRGSTWIPTNYLIFHGLLRYGYKDIAKTLADRTFHLALDENPVTREYYNAETGGGNGLNPFWGWSTLAYVMPLELDLNYDPMDLGKPIRPILRQDLGVSFSSATASRR